MKVTVTEVDLGMRQRNSLFAAGRTAAALSSRYFVGVLSAEADVCVSRLQMH